MYYLPYFIELFADFSSGFLNPCLTQIDGIGEQGAARMDTFCVGSFFEFHSFSL